MNECVFCEKHFLMMEDLAKHLVRAHPDQLRKPSLVSDWYVKCWCGLDVRFRLYDFEAVSPLARHLVERGGLAAHLLEFSLGLTSNQEKTS